MPRSCLEARMQGLRESPRPISRLRSHPMAASEQALLRDPGTRGPGKLGAQTCVECEAW